MVPIRMNSAEHRDHHAHRQPHLRRGAAAGLLVRSSGTMHEIGDAGRDADHGRNEERAAPADPRGQDRGDAGGERHAEIAADAVEGERAAAVGRGRDHDRGADRMIDRGEHAEREQRDRERNEVRRQRRGGAGSGRSRCRTPPSCSGGSSGRRASPPAARRCRRRRTRRCRAPATRHRAGHRPPPGRSPRSGRSASRSGRPRGRSC